MNDYKPRKEDWEASKLKSEEMIVINKMQIMMAENIIKLCNKKIAEFPKESKK